MRNTVDPEFTKTIPLEYRFEEAQRLRFIVYDLDDELATADRDYLGFLQCTLGEVCVCVCVCSASIPSSDVGG